MEKIVKCPKRQDCHYKLTPGSSNETSINLSNEIFKILMPEGAPSDTAIDVTFKVYKEDYIKALCYLIGKLPLYKTASGKSTEITYSSEFFTSQCDIINSFFGQNDEATYHANLLNRGDGRIYLNNLNDNGFNVRRFLIESNTILVFYNDNNNLTLRIETGEELYNKHSADTTDERDREILISEEKLTTFILKCVTELSNIDQLASMGKYTGDILYDTPIKIASAEGGFTLTGMFIKTSEDKLLERNTPRVRWFNEQFNLNGHNVYLSTQWYGEGEYQLTLQGFINMLNTCYPGKFTYSFEGSKHTLRGYHKNEPEIVLQTIYYGSPGTGKSHIVEHKVLDGVPEHFQFRTTFHPDTDYASFVGCYKPVCKDGEDNCQIVYEFVPQVFTDAYVAAWQNPNQQVYLVIEEINRGNCAQIFGDLFQLLDRKNGVSQYKVKAEKDLANYLMEMLAGDAEGGILDGKLSLPANLNIVATMNTSDQSLFPMDSAFKRRWDWKYIPTTPPTDKNKVIEIGDRKYDWKEFLNQINERIQEATRSEDKKLGFWFVKTQEGKDIISDNTFASKVIFYLWNDVFKDLGDKGNPFVSEVGGKTALTSFNSFFMMNSDGDVVVNVDAIHKFMANLGLNPIE